MDVLRQIQDLADWDGPLHLAIGVFDGLHLGHQAVLSAAVQGAKASGGHAALVTFDPHPITVLRPEMRPRLLTHTRHKLALAEQYGVHRALVIGFDEAFSQLPAADFVESLSVCTPDLRQISVGRDWRFGCDRAGDLDLLRELGQKHGFSVNGAVTVEVEGEAVSSTAIRQAIETGDLERAAKFLGRPYAVLGTVVEGRKLGRSLGFPTANLLVHNEQLPPSGVYVVSVQFRGARLGGVGNLGLRPTVEGEQAVERRLEIHLLDLKSEEFYGEELEVCFQKFLRPEQRFDGLDALQAQVHDDIERARAIFEG